MQPNGIRTGFSSEDEGAAAEGGVVLKGAWDKALARRWADKRGSVQGDITKSTDHRE